MTWSLKFHQWVPLKTDTECWCHFLFFLTQSKINFWCIKYTIFTSLSYKIFNCQWKIPQSPAFLKGCHSMFWPGSWDIQQKRDKLHEGLHDALNEIKTRHLVRWLFYGMFCFWFFFIFRLFNKRRLICNNFTTFKIIWSP